jgi:hypothetical protein
MSYVVLMIEELHTGNWFEAISYHPASEQQIQRATDHCGVLKRTVGLGARIEVR